MKGNRVIVGILIALFFTAAVLLRQFSALIVDMMFLVVIVIAGIEMARAVANKYAPPITAIVAFFPIVAVGAFIGGTYLQEITPFLNGLTMVLLVDLLTFGVSAIVVAASKTYTKDNWLSTVFVVIYPMTLAMFFIGLNHFGLQTGAFAAMPEMEVYGATLILLLFLISSLSDTMAFCIGKLFKGPKLAPKISPKKTVSGAIGGLIGGVIGAAAGMGIALANVMGIFALPFVTNAGTFVLHAILLGLFGSVFTQGGDLIASVVKREVCIKDYGKLLGNHGGVMDRIDGQMFNAFFLFIYFTVMGII